ncbi:hypothetical protein BD413DRAFT_613090 [Trametes elegans]|nr:hypothetical protein BD413DRAFT_613090 [Trametes elegans]
MRVSDDSCWGLSKKVTASLTWAMDGRETHSEPPRNALRGSRSLANVVVQAIAYPEQAAAPSVLVYAMTRSGTTRTASIHNPFWAATRLSRAYCPDVHSHLRLRVKRAFSALSYLPHPGWVAAALSIRIGTRLRERVPFRHTCGPSLGAHPKLSRFRIWLK